VTANQSLERTRWAPAVRFAGRQLVARRSAPDPLVKPARGVQGTFELRSDSGRASFFSRFAGFHVVVSELKAQNPSMTIEGC
jgi:hypothetical protein